MSPATKVGGDTSQRWVREFLYYSATELALRGWNHFHVTTFSVVAGDYYSDVRLAALSGFWAFRLYSK